MDIKGFIPQKVNNKTVVSFYDFLRFIDKPIHNTKSIAEHKSINDEAVLNHKLAEGQYIEDQNKYTDMSYGAVSMRYSGCEIIAVYNAFRYIFGREFLTLPELIADFEQNGMVLNGWWGTSPKAIKKYVSSKGLKTMGYHDKDMLNKLQNKNCVILTFYNDGRDIMHAVHTVCVARESDGYYGHNIYGTGKIVGPFDSLETLFGSINKGHSKLIYAFSVE